MSADQSGAARKRSEAAKKAARTRAAQKHAREQWEQYLNAADDLIDDLPSSIDRDAADAEIERLRNALLLIAEHERGRPESDMAFAALKGDWPGGYWANRTADARVVAHNEAER